MNKKEGSGEIGVLEDAGTTQDTSNVQPGREDKDKQMHPGKLDKDEGRSNNGELGGGIKKEDE